MRERLGTLYLLCGSCIVTADAFIIGSASLVFIFFWFFRFEWIRPVVVVVEMKPPVCLFSFFFLFFGVCIGPDG